ncbi:MAG: hypothetical protein MUD12_12960 [Spirochaetes bacterium]|nr:hypothetical protein [Spirochaetota bacterium]
MKKILVLATALVVCMTGMLYSAKISLYQAVDLFICEESQTLAEMLAKTKISRMELYTVSYCSCNGVDPGFKKAVTKTSCEKPKDMVYSCICIGRSSY